jgi:hypothetical protein
LTIGVRLGKDALVYLAHLISTSEPSSRLSKSAR